MKELQGESDGLAADTTCRWRARILTRNPFFPRSQWMSLSGNDITEIKFRTGLRAQLGSWNRPRSAA